MRVVQDIDLDAFKQTGWIDIADKLVQKETDKINICKIRRHGDIVCIQLSGTFKSSQFDIDLKGFDTVFTEFRGTSGVPTGEVCIKNGRMYIIAAKYDGKSVNHLRSMYLTIDKFPEEYRKNPEDITSQRFSRYVNNSKPRDFHVT